MIARALSWIALLALAQGDPARPADPWVLRGELDGRPRAVVVGLESRLWLDYDAETCSLARVFGGGVRDAPDGEGYVVAGPTYTQGSQGSVWWIERAGTATAAEAIFRGYRFQGRQVTLRYELRASDGLRVQIEETPEFERPEDLYEDPSAGPPWMKPDLIGLRRTFKATGIPAGVRVCLTLRARCAGYVAYDRILPEGEREVEVSPGVTVRELFARLLIEADNSTNDIHFFFSPAAAVAARTPTGGGR